MTVFVLIFSIFSCAVSFEADTPVYDPTFNNNAGGFFANGTPITITEGSSLDTVIVSWNDSINSEEELGFFGEFNGYKYLINDARKLTQIVKKSFPGKNIFLLLCYILSQR